MKIRILLLLLLVAPSIHATTCTDQHFGEHCIWREGSIEAQAVARAMMIDWELAHGGTGAWENGAGFGLQACGCWGHEYYGQGENECTSGHPLYPDCCQDGGGLPDVLWDRITYVSCPWEMAENCELYPGCEDDVICDGVTIDGDCIECGEGEFFDPVSGLCSDVDCPCGKWMGICLVCDEGDCPAGMIFNPFSGCEPAGLSCADQYGAGWIRDPSASAGEGCCFDGDSNGMCDDSETCASDCCPPFIDAPGGACCLDVDSNGGCDDEPCPPGTTNMGSGLCCVDDNHNSHCDDAEDFGCPTGYRRHEGVCIPDLIDPLCPTGFIEVSGVCFSEDGPDKSDKDCPAGTRPVGDACVPDDVPDCPEGFYRSAGSCTPIAPGTTPPEDTFWSKGPDGQYTPPASYTDPQPDGENASYWDGGWRPPADRDGPGDDPGGGDDPGPGGGEIGDSADHDQFDADGDGGKLTFAKPTLPSHPALPIEEIDFADAPGWSSGLDGGGSCPAPLDVDYLGYSVSFSFGDLCNYAPYIRAMVIATATFAGVLIISGARF